MTITTTRKISKNNVSGQVCVEMNWDSGLDIERKSEQTGLVYWPDSPCRMSVRCRSPTSIPNRYPAHDFTRSSTKKRSFAVPCFPRGNKKVLISVEYFFFLFMEKYLGPITPLLSCFPHPEPFSLRLGGKCFSRQALDTISWLKEIESWGGMLPQRCSGDIFFHVFNTFFTVTFVSQVLAQRVPLG